MQSVLEDLLGTIATFVSVAKIRSESQATQWLQDHPDSFDLALVDLVLENGSGFGLIRRCRTCAPNARVIILSEYASPAVTEKCVEMGADAVYSKGQIREFCEFVGQLPVVRAPSRTHGDTGERRENNDGATLH